MLPTAAADPHIRTNERDFLCEVLATEAAAVSRFAARLQAGADTGIHAAVDLFEACRGHVVVSGMGKSGLVGAKISATLSSLGQPSHFVHPAEAVHGDLGSIRPDDVVMLLSWSGETQEVVALASILRMDGIPTVGMSGKAKSSLARACAVHVDLGDLTEACPLNLAPTASTTLTLAVGDALALALAQRRDFGKDDFHKHHPGGMLGAGLRPVTEVLRFRVGQNLAAVPDTSTVRDALRAAGEGRRAGAIVLVIAGLVFIGDRPSPLTAAQPPDLILMDVGLPGMDGWQATRVLKSDPATAGIAVVALTAHAMSGDREKAVAAGCDAYETKPIDFAALFTKVDNLLKRRSGFEDPAPGSP
jgi:arabinose-5-phosphate isomerase